MRTLQQELTEKLNMKQKTKRNIFDLTNKNISSFYKRFKPETMLVINETLNSYIVLMPNKQTISLSKQHTIKQGNYLEYIETWYWKQTITIRDKQFNSKYGIDKKDISCYSAHKKTLKPYLSNKVR